MYRAVLFDLSLQQLGGERAEVPVQTENKPFMTIHHLDEWFPLIQEGLMR